MTVVVLARHGESDWNARGLLTGWGDPELTELGKQQARNAGRLLQAEGLRVDRAHASVLRRAAQTAAAILEAAGAPSAPVSLHWRLNERHLGALEGLSKSQIVARWGNGERKRLRDEPSAVPPPLAAGDPRHPRHDARYKDIAAGDLPNGEDRRALARRVLDAWHGSVVAGFAGAAGAAGAGAGAVLVVAHQGPVAILAHHLVAAGIQLRAAHFGPSTGSGPERTPNGGLLVAEVDTQALCCSRAQRHVPVNPGCATLEHS